MGVAYRAIASAPSYLHSDLFRTAFVAMAEHLGGSLDEAAAQEALQRQYAATIDGARLRPDCLETLARLRADGLHLQIVSNIDDELMHPLADRLGVGGAVDALTSSQEAGSCKPDPAIYRLRARQSRHLGRAVRSSSATRPSTTSKGLRLPGCGRRGWSLTARAASRTRRPTSSSNRSARSAPSRRRRRA